MAVLPIVLYPHAALTTPARPVDAFDAELAAFLESMAETMYAANGVGLAANQVAALRRVAVIDCAGEGEPAQLLELVNPQVVDRQGSITWNEGCLSFPDLYTDIRRAAQVRVSYQTRAGESKEIEATGLLAVALQHEIDHLDGIVFTERLGPIEKRVALRKYRKIMERRSTGTRE
jgi:peptide deformylase